MTEPMVTRGPLAGTEMTVPWMLTSGHINEDGEADRWIHLYVVGEDRTALRLDLPLHGAGELYAALEAHMENVAEAAPITPEERDRLLRKDHILKGNLRAVRDEIASPEPPKPSGDMELVDAEFMAAMEDVVNVWVNYDAERQWWVRTHNTALAAALDKLAALNA